MNKNLETITQMDAAAGNPEPTGPLMSAPVFPAPGSEITGSSQLMALEPGASIRYRTPAGAGLAIKNEDGTWSGTGVRELMDSYLLSQEITDVFVISPAAAGHAA